MTLLLTRADDVFVFMQGKTTQPFFTPEKPLLKVCLKYTQHRNCTQRKKFV